jgi:hypothetical protein
MTREITKLQGILENIVKLHATEQNIFDNRISAACRGRLLPRRVSLPHRRRCR